MASALGNLLVMDSGADFLVAVLGQQGADALRKACQRDPSLVDVLVPRAILGWLRCNDFAYEGGIPGLENSYLDFEKNEGGSYDGHVSLPDTEGLLDFQGAGLAQLAATVAAALGISVGSADPRLRDQVVVALGKHIDHLAETQIELVELRKSNLGLKVISDHGAYRVEKAEDGKYMVVAKSGGILRSAVRNLRDAADYADGAQSAWGGSFRHELSKKVLDPSEGIRIEHHDGKDIFGNPALNVTAHAPDGRKVGWAAVYHTPTGLKAGSITVDESHRRKGIATAMYQHAERITGKRMEPSKMQTDAGQGLWSQPGRSFGKGGTEGPGPAAPPQAPEGPAGPQGVQSKAVKPKGLPGASRASRIPSLKVGKAEAERSCGHCGGHQFAAGVFRGCVCFRTLRKDIAATAYSDGYVLDFADSVDPEGALALMRSLKGAI